MQKVTNPGSIYEDHIFNKKQGAGRGLLSLKAILERNLDLYNTILDPFKIPLKGIYELEVFFKPEYLQMELSLSFIPDQCYFYAIFSDEGKIPINCTGPAL